MSQVRAKIYTIPEAASKLDVPLRTLYARLKSRGIGHKVGRTLYLREGELPDVGKAGVRGNPKWAKKGGTKGKTSRALDSEE